MHFKHIMNPKAFKLPSEMENIPNNVWLILMGLSLYTLSWGFANPILPIYFKQIVNDYSGVGILYSLMYVGGIFLSIPMGNLLDRVKKLKILSYGLFTYSFIGIGYILSSFLGPVLLIITRLTHSVTVLSIWLPAQSEIKETCPKNQASNIFAINNLMITCSILIGTIILALFIYLRIINESNLYLTFILLIPIPIFLGTWFMKQANRSTRQCECISQGINNVIYKDKLIMKEVHDVKQYGKTFYIILSLYFILNFASAIVLVFTPLLGIEFGMDLLGVVLLYLVIKIPAMFSFFTHKINKVFGEVNTVYGLMMILSFLFIIVNFIEYNNLLLLFTILFFISICEAIAKPIMNGIITELTPKNKMGEMTGIESSVAKTAFFLGPIIAGVVADAYNLHVLFGIMGVIFIIIIGLLLIKRKELISMVQEYSIDVEPNTNS